MTSLVSWIGADSRGPASVYIATDSRISWDATQHWDKGRKVFACRHQPEIFGYVGDVLFPTLVIGQVVNAIDEGLILQSSDTPQQKADKIGAAIEKAFFGMPTTQQNDFKIIYVTRQNEKMEASFHAFAISWNKTTSWSTEIIETPSTSDTIVIWGSGATSIGRWKDRWNQSSQKDTSRAVFSCLCDSIQDGADPRSGGSPQLVGIYRIGAGRLFGVVSDDTTHLFGLQIAGSTLNASTVEWRNRFFESKRPNFDSLSSL